MVDVYDEGKIRSIRTIGSQQSDDDPILLLVLRSTFFTPYHFGSPFPHTPTQTFF